MLCKQSQYNGEALHELEEKLQQFNLITQHQKKQMANMEQTNPLNTTTLLCRCWEKNTENQNDSGLDTVACRIPESHLKIPVLTFTVV